MMTPTAPEVPQPATARSHLEVAIFEAEEVRWRELLARQAAELQQATDEACARFSGLRLSQAETDPQAAARFDAFRSSIAACGELLRKDMQAAWAGARARLRAGMELALLSPGEPAPASGQYEIVDDSGLATGEERTAIQGRPLPPPPHEGQKYRLVDSTRNNAGVANGEA